MFSTKGQEVKTGGISKSFQPGVVYAHIHSGQVRTSSKGDKKTLELILEGPALDGFEGWDIERNNPAAGKFKGQSARVSATNWTADFNTPNVLKNEIMSKLLMIGAELGMRDAIDSINAPSLELWVAQAINILKDRDLYFFLNGQEEEYNGKTIVKLSLPKYKFANLNEDKLDKFDKTNKWHYKPLEKKPATPGWDAALNADDDFPF